MEVNIHSQAGEAGSILSVSDAVFSQEFNEGLVHQVVVAYRAGARQGTKAQKNRSDVRGGGKKPWKQKGTGRARAGSSSSPLWRGGGVTFPSVTRDFSQKVNRKMYRSAMRSVFSELLRAGRLKIVESFSVDTHKTKDLLAALSTYGLDKTLILLPEVDKNMALASRNLYTVKACEVSSLSPLDLIAFDHVLVTVDTIKKLEEWLS